MPTIHSLDRAFQEHVDGLGDIASCVVAERVVARPSSIDARSVRQFSLAVPGAMRARHGGRSAYRADFRQIARGVTSEAGSRSSWSVDIIAYEYRLLDHHERELVVYHWQPGEIGHAARHVHISASLAVQVNADIRQRVDLDKRHLITGRIELADFVRMLITEFDVRPLRPNWQTRLADAPG